MTEAHQSRRAVVAYIAAAIAVIGSVLLAAVWVAVTGGATNEIVALAFWSLPLGAMMAWFGAKPRISLALRWFRALVTGVIGLCCGVMLTLLGWFLIGGWMLAWDFPVLLCWSVGGTLAALAAGALHKQFSWSAALLGAVPTISCIGALWWASTRPQPAVLITYRDVPNNDAAQMVLDSVITRRSVDRDGNTVRWPYTQYSRGETASGATSVLLTFSRVADRDSFHVVVAKHPFVVSVVDSMIHR